jgi:hypothetical protein
MQNPPRKHVRLPGCSYGTPGSYLVTVCCAQRQPLLDDEAATNIVRECWDALHVAEFVQTDPAQWAGNEYFDRREMSGALRP